MAQLFQQRVLNEFIKNQDDRLIKKRWSKFQEFQSKVNMKRNNKKSDLFREQEYQTGFLIDVFENCLDYKLNINTGNNDFNLRREVKNESDSRRADAVIIVDNNIVGVIELKAQDTKYLNSSSSKYETPVEQAFGYLTAHKAEYAKYVIVSNFNELRFYIQDRTDYEQFNLFDLDFEEFKKLHTILSYESISSGLPLKIKQKSVNFEADITDDLYKEYTKFRTKLFENIKQNNTTINEVKLLALTQKLIDRIVFILFAEDTDILPINSIYTIIEEHKNNNTGWNKTRTLYDFYKIYFEAIDVGEERLSISAYNGGLFAKDEMLDSLIVDDYVLDEQAKKLSDYRFGSDISVNILGHIFEKSITALEEITAQIQNKDYDKRKSQQKIDGAFYTPQYITKYIVDDTLGVLCNDKKQKLNLFDEQVYGNKNLSNKLKEYKEWLLNLKILDPACGSGAFLNQALEFLINEHTLIVDMQNELIKQERLLTVNKKGQSKLFDSSSNEYKYYDTVKIHKEILENNLYGVDINEGAVEIAKLSLWLKTAEKGKPLTRLAEKIKIGNSLISDKSVVHNAFEWKKEFPEVFQQGGFDVIIGNPPYIRVQGIKENFEKESFYYETQYKSAIGKYDIYVLFMERSFTLLNKNGKLGFILPHKFLVTDFGKGIREFLSKNKAVESLLHFGSEMIFSEASAYTCIITLSHNNDSLHFKSLKPSTIFNEFTYDSINYKKLNSNKWNLKDSNITNVLDKLNNQPLKVKDIFKGIYQGIKTGDDKIFVMKGKIENDLFIGFSRKTNKIITIEKDIVKPVLKGEDIKKYAPLDTSLYIIYPHYIDTNNNTKPYKEDYFKNNFPLTYAYLLNFKEDLIVKKIRYKTNPIYWYSLHRARELNLINQEKILTADVSFKSNMSLDLNNSCHIGQYNLIKNVNVLENYKFYLALLNSSLMWFFIKNTSTEFRGGFFVYQTKYIEPFPLPKLDNLKDQEPFIKKVDFMLEFNKKLQSIKQNFINELELQKVPKKLQNFEELEFEEFVKEYKKAKKLKFKDKLDERHFKDEWRQLFEHDKKEALEFQLKIHITDKEIDKMVYELYNLNEEEIKIIKDSITQT